MTNIIARLQREFRVISERKEAKAKASARLGYLGGHGGSNLGDDAMFEAAAALFPSARVLSYLHPSQEIRLAQWGLAGPSYFNAVLLGGGTLINPYPFWIEQTRTALNQDIPLYAVGTGVGSFGFEMNRQVDLAEWIPLLQRYRKIGVRGPRSLEALQQSGIQNAEVVGDLALSLTWDRAKEPANPPRVAVNVSVKNPDDYGRGDYERLPELETVLKRLTQQGWEPVFIAMHEWDIAPLKQLQRGAGLEGLPIAMPPTAAEFFELVSPCTFTLAVRLHTAILSCCVGVPPLMLGYRDKCRDFMESVELTSWYVELHTAKAGEVESRAMQLSEEASALRPSVLGKAQRWRNCLRCLAADIIAQG